MQKITEVTRRDLFDIIQDGFPITEEEARYDADFSKYYENGTSKIKMPFCGRLNDYEFLSRLYDLENMPSTDRRFKNAKGDIRCHTVSFDDWPQFWFLEDGRFELTYGNADEPILNFICEMLHPTVRDEESPWKAYLKKFNELLKPDGYEIYASYRISGHEVYKAREISEQEVVFDISCLFTKRYKALIDIGHGMPIDNVCDTIDSQAKKRLCNVLLEFAEPTKIRPNRYGSWEITTDAFAIAVYRLNDICEYPVISLGGNFASKVDENQLTQCFTPYLFDLIELQHDELSKSEKQAFRQEVNTAFLRENANFRLTDDGIIERIIVNEVLDKDIQLSVEKISEPGLKDLLDEAIALHMQSNFLAHKDAVEKIWDALERLKTYYTTMDKKASVDQIIHDMSGNQASFDEIFAREFKTLTEIGNNFRIRHHETNRINITDDRHYDYFFNRCISLIALAIQYLK